MSLARFFAFVARQGAPTVPARELARALGEDEETLEVLRARRLVQDGPQATTLPCGRAGCAREVRRDGLGFVAVCTREPRDCETLEVSADDLRQLVVSLGDLAAVLRELLGVEAKPRADAKGSDPMLLGEQPHAAGTRDVFLYVRPEPRRLADWLAIRERAARATLLLVPTAESLAPELAARHGPGAHAEVDVLADAITLRDGALTLAPRLRVVRAPEPALAPAPAPALVGQVTDPRPLGAARLLPAVARWKDVSILLVDGETVNVVIARRYQKLSFLDLGLGGRKSREPVKAWRLLVACCEGRGTFEWNEFGSFNNAQQVVSRLRAALKGAFGLEEDPFEEFAWGTGWRTKFRAGLA